MSFCPATGVALFCPGPGSAVLLFCPGPGPSVVIFAPFLDPIVARIPSVRVGLGPCIH